MDKKNKQQLQGVPVPKWMVIGFKTLEQISPYMAMRIAAHIFSKPIKFRAPMLEKQQSLRCTNTLHHVTKIGENIMVYEWENAGKRILINHGWSSRGTQMYHIAEQLHAAGFHVISYDAPAHGKSSGSKTNMLQILEVTQYLKNYYGEFHALIGHSLGGGVSYQYVKQSTEVKKLVTIASIDKLSTVFENYTAIIGLSKKACDRMTVYFERKYKVKISDFDSYLAAKQIAAPTLVIHDKYDYDVSIDAANNITKHHKNATLMVTQGLGHSKILSDPKVVDAITSFITTP